MNERLFLVRFEASETNEAGCRIWSGHVAPDGYGRYGRLGRLAHRLTYERWVGRIPSGMTVDHICFNLRCVEPTHLRLLSRAMNARNKATRHALVPDGECINGHEFTPDNTYIKPNGSRSCRPCNRLRVAEYKARRRAAA